MVKGLDLWQNQQQRDYERAQRLYECKQRVYKRWQQS